jgi:hypothetical protein
MYNNKVGLGYGQMLVCGLMVDYLLMVIMLQLKHNGKCY